MYAPEAHNVELYGLPPRLINDDDAYDDAFDADDGASVASGDDLVAQVTDDLVDDMVEFTSGGTDTSIREAANELDGQMNEHNVSLNQAVTLVKKIAELAKNVVGSSGSLGPGRHAVLLGLSRQGKSTARGILDAKDSVYCALGADGAPVLKTESEVNSESDSSHTVRPSQFSLGEDGAYGLDTPGVNDNGIALLRSIANYATNRSIMRISAGLVLIFWRVLPNASLGRILAETFDHGCSTVAMQQLLVTRNYRICFMGVEPGFNLTTLKAVVSAQCKKYDAWRKKPADEKPSNEALNWASCVMQHLKENYLDKDKPKPMVFVTAKAQACPEDNTGGMAESWEYENKVDPDLELNRTNLIKALFHGRGDKVIASGAALSENFKKRIGQFLTRAIWGTFAESLGRDLEEEIATVAKAYDMKTELAAKLKLKPNEGRPSYDDQCATVAKAENIIGATEYVKSALYLAHGAAQGEQDWDLSIVDWLRCEALGLTGDYGQDFWSSVGDDPLKAALLNSLSGPEDKKKIATGNFRRMYEKVSAFYLFHVTLIPDKLSDKWLKALTHSVKVFLTGRPTGHSGDDTSDVLQYNRGLDILPLNYGANRQKHCGGGKETTCIGSSVRLLRLRYDVDDRGHVRAPFYHCNSIHQLAPGSTELDKKAFDEMVTKLWKPVYQLNKSRFDNPVENVQNKSDLRDAECSLINFVFGIKYPFLNTLTYGLVPGKFRYEVVSQYSDGSYSIGEEWVGMELPLFDNDMPFHINILSMVASGWCFDSGDSFTKMILTQACCDELLCDIKEHINSGVVAYPPASIKTEPPRRVDSPARADAGSVDALDDDNGAPRYRLAAVEYTLAHAMKFTKVSWVASKDDGWVLSKTDAATFKPVSQSGLGDGVALQCGGSFFGLGSGTGGIFSYGKFNKQTEPYYWTLSATTARDLSYPRPVRLRALRPQHGTLGHMMIGKDRSGRLTQVSSFAPRVKTRKILVAVKDVRQSGGTVAPPIAGPLVCGMNVYNEFIQVATDILGSQSSKSDATERDRLVTWLDTIKDGPCRQQYKKPNPPIGICTNEIGADRTFYFRDVPWLTERDVLKERVPRMGLISTHLRQ